MVRRRASTDGRPDTVERRGFLAGLAGVGVASLAGCTESAPPSGPARPPDSPTPTETPVSGIEVIAWDIENGSDGSLLVPITLKNSGGRGGNTSVVVSGVAANESFEEVRTVNVPAGETRNVTVKLDATFREFVKDGSIELEVEGDD